MNAIENKIGDQGKQPEMLPRFEALRSSDPYHESDHDDSDPRQAKITVPIKRINKKLSDILTEVQTSGHTLKGIISDFRLQFSEHSQEQAVILQNFAKNFASIEQIVGEHSKDFSR